MNSELTSDLYFFLSMPESHIGWTDEQVYKFLEKQVRLLIPENSDYPEYSRARNSMLVALMLFWQDYSNKDILFKARFQDMR